MTLVTIRTGFTLRDNAADSAKRMEKRYGRQIDVNRSTVDYAEQEKLYNEWLAGKHPDIPVVLDPDESVHVYREPDTHSGVAVDSDTYDMDWEDHGWIQVNKKELWHREYFPQHDNHINETVKNEGLVDSKMARVISSPMYRAANQWVWITEQNAFPISQVQRAALLPSGIPYCDYPDEDGFNVEISLAYQTAANVNEANAKKILDEFGERIKL